MKQCVEWPLGPRYQVINRDGLLATGTNLIFFGPDGPANTNLAWLIFELTFSYSGAAIAGGAVTPFYQQNGNYRDRRADLRVTLGRQVTDANNNFPIIGGAPVKETAAGAVISPAHARPLYVPYPDELIIGFTGGVANTPYQVRGLILEVPREVDVSSLF